MRVYRYRASLQIKDAESSTMRVGNAADVKVMSLQWWVEIETVIVD